METGAEAFAARLVAARLKLGLTQASAARRWGISVRTLIYWEGGEHAPLPDRRVRLERILARIEQQTAAR